MAIFLTITCMARKKDIDNKVRSPMPQRISPMLCTLIREPVDDPDYLYEIKWDGYRIVSYVNGNSVRMDSRSALDYTSKYPLVVKALRALKRKMVVDGEVVVFNDQGIPDFDALQVYNGHESPVHYCVFDILWLDGYDLTQLPLEKRKEILKELILENDVLKFSESFTDGPGLYQQSLELNLEGIVAKKKDSHYNQGERADNWLKVPTRKRQEFVIGGWAESDRGRSFRSLLFGAYNGNKLEWIGRSGGGYKEKDMPAILKQLQKMETKTSPFSNKVLDTKGATIHWVKPQLVANFEFATWTKSGRIRKPATFLGFRSDKHPKQVVREQPVVPATTIPTDKTSVKTNTDSVTKNRKLSTTADSNWPQLEKVKPKVETSIDIDGCTIPLSDVDRQVWKGVTKADLINYYHQVAPFLLPHLKDRPLSLHIKPNGATAPGLYIKDMEGRGPECAEIFVDKRRHAKAGKRNTIDYLVCNNEATLLYLIDLGCIDINPWMSRTEHPTIPDFINIDLDPTGDDFSKVIDTALAAKQVLEKLRLKSFIKTSGKTGMHIYIPIVGISNEAARRYSDELGKMINVIVPRISTIEISKGLRGDKVLIDPSQNDYADTLASAYSARPYHLPTVSTPLQWKEIKASLDPHDFTIKTILKRLGKKGDLFAGTLNARIAKVNASLLSKGLD